MVGKMGGFGLFGVVFKGRLIKGEIKVNSDKPRIYAPFGMGIIDLLVCSIYISRKHFFKISMTT
ncbi:hypothetical protein BSPWISOXPB_2276 [uncultured Gammaproteobacteria bacterium]|nr:hypothetical protein BSPWISOXPB_2276 [uncultured Gammaproteobacteria bacterium]